MKTIYLRSRVGADGILQLRVPTDASNAELDVMVVVTPAISKTPAVPSDWTGFVRATAGTISDDQFVRQPQGEFEKRDELP